MGFSETENGFSFLNPGDEQWDFVFGDDNFRPTALKPETVAMISEGLRKPPVPIQNRDAYFRYLRGTLDRRESAGMINPHKAWIQLQMFLRGINESATKIIDSSDPGTLVAYTRWLLEVAGHSEVWWGTADEDDESDPLGASNISPPLYKRITSGSQILSNLENAYQFWEEHPHFLFKVFPQDKEKPSLLSMVVTDGTGEKSIRIKIRVGEYTTSERYVRNDKPPEIYIDFNGPVPIIIVENKQHLKWVQIIRNSIDIFKKLDLIPTQGSKLINPEALIFGNGRASRIAFFTDVIFGAQPNSGEYAKDCPRIAPYLEKLDDQAIVLINRRNSDLINRVINRATAIQMVEDLRSELYEIEQGGARNTQNIVAVVSALTRASYLVPPLIEQVKSAPLSTEAITEEMADPDTQVLRVYRTPAVYFPNRPTQKQISTLPFDLMWRRDEELTSLLDNQSTLGDYLRNS